MENFCSILTYEDERHVEHGDGSEKKAETIEEVADDEEVDVGDVEHLEEGDEQHEDDDSERLPQRLQGNVLLLLPAQGFPEMLLI